jgi:hypothetical protein
MLTLDNEKDRKQYDLSTKNMKIAISSYTEIAILAIKNTSKGRKRDV